MSSIAEEAKSYEAGRMGNITEVAKVSTSSEVHEKVFKEGTVDEFKVKYINQDGEDYRVPSSVLASLKSLLEEKPTLKFFKVRKDGTGMSTRYTVIPLE